MGIPVDAGQTIERNGIGTAYTLPHPIWLRGSRQIARSALWRRRGGNVFTTLMGIIGVIVLLSFIITGIGGIQYRFGQMLVTNHGDDPHLVVTFTDVILILICVLMIVIPAAIIIGAAWSLLSDLLHGGDRRRLVRDPRTLGVRTDDFGPEISIVRQPDRDDGDDDISSYPIPRILFQSGTAPIEFRMLAYIPATLWNEAGGGTDPRPGWKVRHHMAWLTMQLTDDSIGITKLEPIAVRPVIHAFDGNLNRTVFGYMRTPGIERYDSDYIILGDSQDL